MTTLQEIREEANRRDWVYVPEQHSVDGLVIINVADREEFDRIAVQCKEWNDSDGHRLRKEVAGRTVKVIFTHWIKRS